MFVFESFVVEVLYVGFAIGCAMIAWTLAFGYIVMKLNARKMEAAKTVGAGSLVSHGMVYDDERGVGVKRDSKPSDNWFKKLR